MILFQQLLKLINIIIIKSQNYKDFKLFMDTFADTYNRVYTVRKWTFEHLFCLFIYFVIFALPFYFSFASKNFWLEQQYSQMNIDYYFTGHYAVQINFINGAIVTSEQLAIIPSTKMNQLPNLMFSVKDNTTHSQFSVQLKNFTQDIVSANFLFYYDTQVPQLNKVASSSLAFAIPGNLKNCEVSSVISLDLSTPFNAITSASSRTINRPAYFDTSYRSPSSFVELINAHLENNYKLQSQSYTKLVQDSINNVRKINFTILKNRNMIIPYYPGILETFKFKFSSYFGMLMLCYLIFRNLLNLLIKNQALESNVKDEVPNSFKQAKNY